MHNETGSSAAGAPAASSAIQGLRYRQPDAGDGAGMHALAASSPPLDCNSVYAYLLLCTHFRDTCVVGESGGSLAGFVTAYLEPADPSVLFVWQIAVGSGARGRGVAAGLLRELMRQPACRSVQYLETTITPSNAASRRLFHAFARDRQAACEESPLFSAVHFGTASHEEERLLRIGPFSDGAA